MTCIIVDDEPLGRKAIRKLVEMNLSLSLCGSFGDAETAGEFLIEHPVDLVFLDIRMPGIDGISFARTIQHNTLVIFTTAYPEYAVDSYELDAVDYLLKPVEPARFRKAVDKAGDYLKLLREQAENGSGEMTAMPGHFFVKSDRRYFKINFRDILFVEGLKDYVVIQTSDHKIITKSTLKALGELLPAADFMRTNKSYIVNLNHIESFDLNDIYIGPHELSIGACYRDEFLERMIGKKRGY